MKLALIGRGAMGKLVASFAQDKGHEILVSIDERDGLLTPDELAARLSGVNAAIDFSAADAVERNVLACIAAGIPLVEGTTGWQGKLSIIRAIVEESGGAMVYGANFSIGVNLFYRVIEFAAKLFVQFPEYEAFIEERHHSQKKDAPSGTALRIKQIVDAEFGGGTSVSSTRAGSIPGTHLVGFDGTADQIILEHEARSRHGFAAGSLIAAQWIIGKRGFYDFDEVVDDILRQ